MLVLSRTEGQVVCIGNDIRIIVNEIRPHSVKLGFEAPREVPVYRSEVSEHFYFPYIGECDGSGI